MAPDATSCALVGRDLPSHDWKSFQQPRLEGDAFGSQTKSLSVHDRERWSDAGSSARRRGDRM